MKKRRLFACQAGTYRNLQVVFCGMLLVLIQGKLLWAETMAEVAAGDETGKPITFVIAEVAPWGWKDEDNNPRGLLVDLVEAIEQRINLPLDYSLRPHSRATLELGEGKADYSILFESPRSEAIGERIANVVKMQVLLVGPAVVSGETESPSSLDDLTGEPVGYIRGTYYGEDFVNHPGIERIAVNSMSHGLMLLHRGRLRAMVGTNIAFAEAHGEKAVEGVDVLFSLGPAAGNIYLSKQSERKATASQILRAVESLREEGKLEAIFSAPFRDTPWVN